MIREGKKQTTIMSAENVGDFLGLLSSEFLVVYARPLKLIGNIVFLVASCWRAWGEGSITAIYALSLDCRIFSKLGSAYVSHSPILRDLGRCLWYILPPELF